MYPSLAFNYLRKPKLFYTCLLALSTSIKVPKYTMWQHHQRVTKLLTLQVGEYTLEAACEVKTC